MDEQIKQIAERLRGLRDVLELTAEDIARECDISAEEYRLAESGEFDISVSMLQKDCAQIRSFVGCTDVRRRTEDELLFPNPCRKRNQY